MKTKKLLAVLSSVFFLLCAAPTGAETKRLHKITLRDGSTLYAELVAFEKGVYTFRSETLGEVKLGGQEVLAVEAPEKYRAGEGFDEAERAREISNIVEGLLKDAGAGSILDQALPRVMVDSALLERVLTLQKNPEFRRKVEEMSQDPEIAAAVVQGRIDEVFRKILADPNFSDLLRSLFPEEGASMEEELQTLRNLFGVEAAPRKEGGGTGKTKR